MYTGYWLHVGGGGGGGGAICCHDRAPAESATALLKIRIHAQMHQKIAFGIIDWSSIYSYIIIIIIIIIIVVVVVVIVVVIVLIVTSHKYGRCTKTVWNLFDDNHCKLDDHHC